MFKGCSRLVKEDSVPNTNTHTKMYVYISMYQWIKVYVYELMHGYPYRRIGV